MNGISDFDTLANLAATDTLSSIRNADLFRDEASIFFANTISTGMSCTVASFSWEGRQITPRGTYEAEVHGEKDTDGKESVGGSVSISTDSGTSVSGNASVDSDGNVSAGVSVSGSF